MTNITASRTSPIPGVSTYLAENARFPFCKGCGHTSVLRKLNEALVRLQWRPADIALVTDIGCIGLADGLFDTVHTVHTTHGRSTAFGTGIALADSVLAERNLKTIVLIGDGGAMIGLQHLVHAAMLNVDMTVLICNNFVYGMTGGQGSGLTPEGFLTSTTPTGNILPPADLCEMLRHSNAPFVARIVATDRDAGSTIEQALSFPGFAAVEILELCTEFAVPANELNGKKLVEAAERNRWKLGVLENRTDRAVFADRYQRSHRSDQSISGGIAAKRARLSAMRTPVSIVVAGSAGEGVQSASSLICQSALTENLFVTQKNDNPVTQGSGFSLSEVWISPAPVQFTGIENPDIVVISSEDGLKELRNQGWLERIGPTTRLIIDTTLDVQSDVGTITRLPLRSVFGARAAALGGLAWVSTELKLLDEENLIKATKERFGERGAQTLSAGLTQLRKTGS